jgi:queuosine precursor transporter
MSQIEPKQQRFFIANALIAEFIGVKIFSVEQSIGIAPFSFNILGFEQLSFNMTAGVLLWPVVFIMTDIINEYFGSKGVRLLSYIGVALISYAFIVVYAAMQLQGSDFWMQKSTPNGVINMDLAFNQIFGQGLWIIVGSITAFLIGQLTDVAVFHQIKKHTGNKYLWLRATGSTLVSQGIDSYVVIFIAFYLGNDWSLSQVLAIGTIGYIYKFIVAVLLTPVLYLVHELIDRYLGKDLAQKMMKEAHAD